MKYYIVLTKVHAERIARESNPALELPKSDLTLLAENLGASFITPESCPLKPITLIDKIRAKVTSTPENWAFARAIAERLKPDDIVFCPGAES